MLVTGVPFGGRLFRLWFWRAASANRDQSSCCKTSASPPRLTVAPPHLAVTPPHLTVGPWLLPTSRSFVPRLLLIGWFFLTDLSYLRFAVETAEKMTARNPD